MKYPRTPHLPWSPGRNEDDISLADDLSSFSGNKLYMVTEKLDGQIVFMGPNGIHARSEDSGNDPTLDYAKSVYYASVQPYLKGSSVGLFFEDLTYIHSIEYTNLTGRLYLIGAIRGYREQWMSFDALRNLSERLQIPLPPVLAEGLTSIEEVREFDSVQESAFGGPTEGYVVRNQDDFHHELFQHNVAKYVRAGHVQSPDHWKRNPRKAVIQEVEES